ncbi:MAG: hypothetical protein LBP53_07150 [Candidatus Peribacteria bacterium]|jgi:hypothetical protein|nr:hypothetical protein [Candidatus Peribacteria bacterium]
MLGGIIRYTALTLWQYRNKNLSPFQKLLWRSLLGFGIGFLGLCAEGMVLHSLGDRMVVYPFFLLYGLVIGRREKEKG